MWIRIFVFVMPFKGSFSPFNAYLVVLGLFRTKTKEEEKLITYKK